MLCKLYDLFQFDNEQFLNVYFSLGLLTKHKLNIIVFYEIIPWALEQ